MSKMAPLLGKEITDRHFLPRFSEMCTDPLFHVRKVMQAPLLSSLEIMYHYLYEESCLTNFYEKKYISSGF